MSKKLNKQGSVTHMALTNLISDLARLPFGYKGKNQLPDSYMANLKLKDAKAKGQKRAARKGLQPMGNTRNVMAPTSFGTSSDSLIRSQVVSSTANSSVMRGTTLLGAVESGSTSSGPQAVFSCSSNPVTFADRMGIIAQTFDKYVYKRVTLRYVPACTTTNAGLVMIAIDRDYMDPPNVASLAQTMSYEAIASGSVWSGHQCSMNRDTHERRDYFTNFTASTELRESEQFRFWAYTIGTPNYTILGYLYLDYEVEMISPVYAPSEITSNPSGLFIVPSFTTMLFGGSTTNVTFSFALPFVLPAAGAGGGDIFEMLVVAGLSNPGNAITVGNGTGAKVFKPATSMLLFLKANTAATGWNIYLDYPDAIAANATQTALYNSSLVATQIAVDGCRVIMRQIQGSA